MPEKKLRNRHWLPLGEIDQHLKKGSLRQVVRTFRVLLPFICAGGQVKIIKRMIETMKPAFIIHEVSGLHEVPPGHPERPERHRAIMSAMGDDFLHWTHHQAPKASRDQLELGHSASYVEQIFEATASIADLVPLDADTWAGPHSLETARRAVGGACLAVDLVMQNKASTAFSAMRPPGHHA